MGESPSTMQGYRMMKMTLNKPQQMLFALLRASLHEREVETPYFQGATDDNWKLCYQLACTQGVMALAWDGVLRLPTKLMPYRNLKLTWAMAVEKYESKYHRYCKTVNELSTFYTLHNIATVQLKGVGFSTYYPVPMHREGGDIDIYTYSADKDKLSDVEANKLADTLMEQQHIEVEYHSYKHSNFYYKGIPVENHKSFLNIKDIKEAVQANKTLHQELLPRTVSLTAGKVQIPSPAFNALFISFHALQHYGSGIALHHLCDWAVILKHHGWLIPEDIKDKRFLEGVKALTHLCNEHLGTCVAVDGGKEIATEIMGEILNPPFKTTVPASSKSGILLYKTRSLLHTHRLKSRVFNISLGRRIWDSIISHIRHPESIFSRNEK